MSDNADLKYIASIEVDDSSFAEELNKIEGLTSDAAQHIADEQARIYKTIRDGAVIDIDLSSISNLQDVKDAHDAINQVVEKNKHEIEELQQKYDELKQKSGEAYAAFQESGNVADWDNSYTYARQADAVQHLQNAHKKVIQTCNDLRKEVNSVSKNIEQEAKAAEKAAKAEEKEAAKTKKAEEATRKKAEAANSLKARMKELEAEAAKLVEQAQAEGRTLDQNSGRYREIIEELGRLRDIRGDIRTAGSVFANDEAVFAGVIQGLSGVSGAFSAAQGAIGLFSTENERLNEVMLKVQSLMAITMGLQQLATVLNKDSTFVLVTLNAIQKLFNKTKEESVEVLEDENDAIADNIEELKEDTLEKEVNEVAEQKDADATKANTASKKANATASQQEAAGSEQATGAQNAHTGSLVAGTVATKALTLATKLLKVALISTGIGALVVLVGELVSGIMSLFSAEDEAVKHTKDLQKINEDAAETYIKEKVALEDNIRFCKNFTGSKEEEKKKVDELNSKYGESLGYYDSLAEWEQVLQDRGPAYCEMLRMKAVQQGLLNKYVEEYCKALEVAHKAENGEFDDQWYEFWNWGGKSSEDKRREAIAEANAEADYWKRQMDKQREELEAYQKEHQLDVIHIDPKAKKISGNTKSFDPKKSAQDQKKALDDYRKAVTQYIRDTNASISQAVIDSMEDGYYKEINAMYKQMNDRKKAWQQQLYQLAETLRDTTKAYYLAKDGWDEEKWNASDLGKRSMQDWVNSLLEDENIKNNYEQGFTDIENALQKGLQDIRDKYMKQLVNELGTYDQKLDLLIQEWTKKIGFLSSNPLFEKFVPEAQRQFDEAIASLKAEDFKKTINWDVAFGDMEEQSVQALEVTLNKLKEYFARESQNMGAEQIKIFQEAIDKMEDEIASRNPFTAMHKSFSDISEAKTEFVNAMAEMKAAQEELTEAQQEYKAAFREENDIRASVNDAGRGEETDALMQAQRDMLKAEEDYQNALAHRDELLEKVNSGELAEDSEEYVSAVNAVAEAERERNEAIEYRDELMQNLNDDELAQQCITLVEAQERLSKSETTLTAARERNTKAENNALTARNKITKSYKNFANNLNAAGKVATDVDKKASNLARVFSDDIADGMDKALDCIDEVLDAVTDVISAIGDVGKSVAKGMTQTVDAMGQATQSTAQATATSISTVEKASIILTVISAALQIATAIASLFNDDDKKQKEIERLQERIDQLQWELDNQDAVRLQKNVGNALEQVTAMYQKAREEVLRLHGVMQNASAWTKWIASTRYQSEIYAKTVENIADYWAKVDYTADKALGADKYAQSRKQLENLAEQQLLIQKQLNAEESKKKSDSGAIQDYKNKLAEIAEEMATLINDMLEDIIGQSAEDLAKTLGDAFFEAVKSGEDAMEAWRDKVNEIVSDILQRMMIQKFLEEPLGQIFDKYRKRWFGDDGKFRGIDAIVNSMDDFSNDLNEVGASFQALMNELPDEIKQWFSGDEERSASERGIATASQDSVDENNARLTVIQSHTYTLVQGVAELNATGTQMLDKLANIDTNTAQTANTLEAVQSDMKRVKDAVEDITTRGIKLKN
ncbi:MAG: hypothetical protein NC548_24420 [Lachnospiraceae bacterium]|nr:hypothetical protein [Lachnospiraceae bacterium]